ncbi:MAG: FemAB family PEP-CTERM system-associated protein [Hyphomicrobiales bacterium]|nr:FemAB family PEP-CTERM system-associated protein [Hyphomicrobiales bacterium]MCP5373663.1 FemAB family PEP-CTERM system-associated protein [Hyphomicrobiales bacterium]
MTYDVRPLDAAGRDRWDAFVQACPEATFFHRAGWHRVIEDSFGQKCHFLAAERDGEIRGVLPLVHVRSPIFGNRLVATGFCVGGAPAVTEDGAMAALDARAVALMDELKAEYLEYRDPARPHPDWPKKEGLYATFDRPIEADEDENLKQIPRKQRAVVRKALKSDLVDEVNADIDQFYDLYSLSMRNLGTPVFGRRFIANLVDEFGDDCDIVTVSQGGRPLSSVLNFYFKDRVMPYYTGAAPEARRTGAADLQYWRVMRRAVERGYTVFDFGRSKEGTGPYSFKKNWGFEPRPVVLEFRMRSGGPLPDVNPNNPKYKLMIDVWRRLPLPVANAIGPMIGRQVG